MRFLKVLVLITLTSTLVVGCSQDDPINPADSLGLLPQGEQTPNALVGGFVFVDTDSNGVLDLAEAGFGIANVTIRVTDSLSNIQTLQTDASGAYQVSLPNGTYTLELLSVTPEVDFNEGLFLSFDPTTPMSVVAEVPAVGTTTSINFGFKPKVEEITEKLQTGEIESSGLPVEYWRRQLILALTKLNPPAFGQPNPEEPDYDAAALLGFLTQIEGLAFVDPFQFPDGIELKTALKILGDPVDTPLTDLLKEILAFEFNHAAGLGILGEPGLQLALINYAESVYISAGGLSPSAKKLSLAPTGAWGEDLTTTKLMLEEANRGGGGGPVQ